MSIGLGGAGHDLQLSANEVRMMIEHAKRTQLTGVLHVYPIFTHKTYGQEIEMFETARRYSDNEITNASPNTRIYHFYIDMNVV